jgi:hypothetical protein
MLFRVNQVVWVRLEDNYWPGVVNIPMLRYVKSVLVLFRLSTKSHSLTMIKSKRKGLPLKPRISLISNPIKYRKTLS